MYQPGFGERGWRHLGGQDEVPELYESDPWGPIDKLTPDPLNDSILSYTNKVNNEPTMTRQEELALIGRAQSGDRKAKRSSTVPVPKPVSQTRQKVCFHCDRTTTTTIFSKKVRSVYLVQSTHTTKVPVQVS